MDWFWWWMVVLWSCVILFEDETTSNDKTIGKSDQNITKRIWKMAKRNGFNLQGIATILTLVGVGVWINSRFSNLEKGIVKAISDGNRDIKDEIRVISDKTNEILTILKYGRLRRAEQDVGAKLPSNLKTSAGFVEAVKEASILVFKDINGRTNNFSLTDVIYAVSLEDRKKIKIPITGIDPGTAAIVVYEATPQGKNVVREVNLLQDF